MGTDIERDLEQLYREHGARLWRSLVPVDREPVYRARRRLRALLEGDDA